MAIKPALVLCFALLCVVGLAGIGNVVEAQRASGGRSSGASGGSARSASSSGATRSASARSVATRSAPTRSTSSARSASTPSRSYGSRSASTPSRSYGNSTRSASSSSRSTSSRSSSARSAATRTPSNYGSSSRAAYGSSSSSRATSDSSSSRSASTRSASTRSVTGSSARSSRARVPSATQDSATRTPGAERYGSTRSSALRSTTSLGSSRASETSAARTTYSGSQRALAISPDGRSAIDGTSTARRAANYSIGADSTYVFGWNSRTNAYYGAHEAWHHHHYGYHWAYSPWWGTSHWYTPCSLGAVYPGVTVTTNYGTFGLTFSYAYHNSWNYYNCVQPAWAARVTYAAGDPWSYHYTVNSGAVYSNGYRYWNLHDGGVYVERVYNVPCYTTRVRRLTARYYGSRGYHYRNCYGVSYRVCRPSYYLCPSPWGWRWDPVYGWVSDDYDLIEDSVAESTHSPTISAYGDQRSRTSLLDEPKREPRKRDFTTDVETLLTWAAEDFKSGDYDSAVEVLKEASVARPGDAGIRIQLTNACIASGRYHLADFSLRRALELDSHLISQPMDVREYYSSDALFELIANRLRRASGDQQNFALLEAFMQLYSGDAPTAARTLEAALARKSDDSAARALYSEALSRIESGDN